MSPRPPRLPHWILTRALADDASGSTIIGDLQEDFARLAEERGASAARRWYWREGLSLGLSLLAKKAWRGSVAGISGLGPSRAGGLLQDTHYALRAVRRDGGFFAFATLIIGVGVGASTAVFSVVSPLMLKPLPFEHNDRLAWIANTGEGGGMSAVTSRTSNLRDFRAMSRSFESLSGYNAFFDQSSYNLSGDGTPERLVGVGVAHDFLDVLGVRPLLGRNFSPEEGLWGAQRTVVLTHGLWVRRFAADPSIVGRAITIDDAPTEVVGVLPPSFDFSSVFTPTSRVDFLMPFPISDETDRWGNTISIVGRLAPGATVRSAQDELDAVLVGLQEADPERWGLGARVTPLQEQISGPFRARMLLLSGAAATVMLIVCLNLSNMLLARSPKRAREMAIRRTLGATRPRLVRQLLMESLAMSASGAAVGTLIAVAVTRRVATTQGVTIPMLSSMSVDGLSLAFTALLAVVTGFMVGVVPALQVSEGGEAEVIKSGSRGSSAGRGGARLRELLVVTEVAMACVLLVFGGLFLKSFRAVVDVELGYEPENAVAWQLNTTRPFETLAEANAFFEELVAGVEAIPGVEAAAVTDALPLGTNRTWGVQVVGLNPEETEGFGIFPHIVDSRYIATMGIPLTSGRHFTPDDTQESELVAIVNEAAARAFFPDRDPLGGVLQIARGEHRVVGVVGNVRHEALESSAGYEVYLPYSQVWDFQSLEMVVRSQLPVASLAAAVTRSLNRTDPGMPTDDYWTLSSTVDLAASPRRFTLGLLGAFAATALLLAGLGIYGVLSYTVSERVPEIGIRMALGEPSGDVLGRVVGRTMVLALSGVLIGTVVALVGTRVVRSLLFGVEPTDPLAFAATASILLVVAALAGFVPGLRASRTDSATALRSF